MVGRDGTIKSPGMGPSESPRNPRAGRRRKKKKGHEKKKFPESEMKEEKGPTLDGKRLRVANSLT